MLVLWGCGGDDDPGDNATNTTGVTNGPTTISGAESSDSGSGTEADGSTDEGGADESSSGTDTGAPACPDTHACVPLVPEDWMGPVALSEAFVDEGQPQCDAAFPEAMVEANDDVVAPPAYCDCDCAPSQDAACETQVQVTSYQSDSACGLSSSSFLAAAGVCASVPAAPAGTQYRVAPLEVVSGSCEPVDTMQLEEAAFERAFVACGGAELLDQGCAENTVCAPRPADASPLCVWQEGEHECPETYPEQRISYRDIQDGRGCETCTCGDAEGLCDEAVVRLYSTRNSTSPAGCLGLTAILSGDGSCGTSGSAAGALLVIGQPTAFCTPSPGTPTGEAVGIDPITVCCRAP